MFSLGGCLYYENLKCIIFILEPSIQANSSLDRLILVATARPCLVIVGENQAPLWDELPTQFGKVEGALVGLDRQGRGHLLLAPRLPAAED